MHKIPKGEKSWIETGYREYDNGDMIYVIKANNQDEGTKIVVADCEFIND